MPKVFNWQLKRKMDFPYDEVRPVKQFAAVFNTNRCIACQTCTMACKSTWTFSKGQEHMWWNNVETKPYGGYPHFWDIKTLALLGQQAWTGTKYSGKTIFEAAPPGEVAVGYLPAEGEWKAPNLYEDTSTPWKEGSKLPVHNTWFFYLQRICNHCTYPACLAACPRKAIYKREEDGIVLIDQKRCRGYRECMKACPYKKPIFRSVEEAVSEKCIACFPRREQNTITRCIAACVGKIRLQGFIGRPNKIDEERPMDYLIHEEKVALPLYPQFGTEPNVYYIPPRWVPRDYLKQMFGPGVEGAIERYQNPSKKLLGLLQLFGVTQTIIEHFKVNGDSVIAYDDKGKEIVRTTVDEKFVVREEVHLNIT